MYKEIRVPATTYANLKLCDCGGDFRYTPSDTQPLTYPLKYRHICSQCGKEEWFNKSYPCMSYTYSYVVNESKEGQ